MKRLQEERERQQEGERKVRDQKVQEKRLRDEARQKEREEREARESKAQEEKDRKEREVKERAEKELKQREKIQPSQPPHIMKRPSQAGAIAVPPGLHSQKSNSGLSSPHVAIATPAIPKAPVAIKSRQTSNQESQSSSPKPHSLPTVSSDSASPSSNDHASVVAPKAILQSNQKPQGSQPPPPHSQMNLHQGPPPGMHPPYNTGFGGMNMGFAPFQGQRGPASHQHQQAAPFAQQAPIGAQYRSFPPTGGPSGVSSFGAPPAHSQHIPPIGAPGPYGANRSAIKPHSRQHSVSDRAETEAVPLAPSQPISRPAPIQRPSSVKPGSLDVDDSNRHLGSSALLDDADDPLPPSGESRRTSNPMGPVRPGPAGFSSPLFTNLGGQNSFGNPHSNWSSPGAFGPPGLGTPSWGSSLNANSWSSNAFGSLGAGARSSNPNRPLAIRLAVCHACRQLSQPHTDSYHDVNIVLHQIELNGSLAEGTPSLKEIEDICETEGDAQNGGGMLHVRHSGGSNFAIKHEPDHPVPNSGRPSANQLGEIGSPLPTHSMPTFGGPRGFGSIGGLASPGGF